MSIDSRIQEATSWVTAQLEGRQLIGEIELNEPQRFELIYLIQDMVQFGRSPTQEIPEVISLLLVDLARRNSNGNQLWESVLTILFKKSDVPEAEKNRWRIDLGETFLSTVRQYHMPEFRQLVEEGARKYVGPILAHALMPREHIDTFMEKVIWPAIERPAEVGRDARDIQDWLATLEKRVTTEAVRRFVLYGGPVARDLIDRTLAYCESALRGQADSGSGLPGWLRRGIDQWLKQRQTHVPRHHSSQRRARPAVRFDSYRCEVVVDLPYVDNPATWRVMVAPGGEQYEVDACPPQFARTREKEALGVSRPANALRVELVHEGSQPDRWEIPLLSEDRPVLFFAERDGRLLPAGEVLDGDAWWLLAPGDSKLETDGQLTVCDTLGPPLGWNGYLMQLIRCEGATELRVAPVGWQAASDGPRYRVAGHAQSAFFTQNPLPAWLEPLNTDLLAAEDALPELCIPDRPGSSPERYLSFWEVRAERVGETAETYVLPAARLPRVLQDGTWRLQLHDLIPGCDVGTWNVAANGPIGLGVRQRIGILPAGVRGFDVPLAPRVRRPAADGTDSGDIRLVMVQIPGEVQVATPGDLGQAAGHDVWILKDLDGDGRIPLAVTDSRTGRTTAAVVVLPTVEWRWLSAKPRGWQESAVIPLDEVLAGDWELQVHASAPVRPSLRLVTADGQAVQELGPIRGQRSANFSLRDVSSTVQGRTDRVLYLELFAGNEHGQDAARVGAIERLLTVREVTTRFDDGQLFCSWRQDVDVDGMTAFLEPHWRPWEEPVDGEIEGGSGQYQARWWLNARGPMRLTLRVEDPWVGETTV
ncbi:hypothetical protein, partial [Tepidiforma sp.]|uniref:hypothetical protein n=1 Tax=Tepidiforma sp. TaxID=2682230 RepID=UPI002ADD50F0